MKVSKDLREHIEAQVRAKAAPAREELDALIQAEEAKAREFHDRLDAMAEPVRRRIAAEVEKAFGRGEFRMKWSRSSPTNICLPAVKGRDDHAYDHVTHIRLYVPYTKEPFGETTIGEYPIKNRSAR